MSHNSQNSNTYTKGINHLSDLTHEEFAQRKGGKFDNTANKTYISINRTNAPLEEGVDWRMPGSVSNVKDQGQCGSCWAFSATGAIEGIYNIRVGTVFDKIAEFSEQQLIDCTNGVGGNAGCNGGWPAVAFSYASKTGIEEEYEYSYEAATKKCRYGGLGLVTLSGTGYAYVTPNNPEALVSSVNSQPVSVLIEADTNIFQSYESGIISDPACGQTLDHAVLLIGYGDGYWLLKNSWGMRWGEDGYFRIAKDDNDYSAGICGVQAQGVIPLY